jgi:arylsulfatase A-like enzyme
MTQSANPPAPTRRDFLRNAALASGALAAVGSQPAEAASAPGPRPNVLMICADQFRADFIGAAKENPTTQTPHLDALARRGTMYRKAVCNQPLCSPSRSSFMTSRYATETGVWKLELEPDHSIPTIANVFDDHGYETGFIGKWHVSDKDAPDGKPQPGWIPPGPSRGGFQSWEGANILELVSHPDHGSYWDNSGKNIGFQNEYRVDFLTDRAVRWLQQKHDKPWFLFLSQLEPHHQNDVDQFVAPERYKNSFNDPFVPADLRALPGNWQTHLPGYYGCVQAIDDCVGRIVDTLQKTGQLDNTVILFFSDHGCTFRTRMGEYKRSPYDSSIRVPFILAGPGFDRAQVVDELISLLDLTPTLLDAAGVTPPSEMKGRSVLPLAASPQTRSTWDNTAYIQISDSMCARALRTPEWCYVVYDPAANPKQDSHSTEYTELALYSVTADPSQQTNLIARPGYQEIAAKLRADLLSRLAAAAEPAAKITPAKYYL